MSSTLGLVNLDEFDVKKIYPDSRVNNQWISLPSTMEKCDSPQYASYIQARLQVNDRLVCVANEDGMTVDHYMLDLNRKGMIAFLTTYGIKRETDCLTTQATFANRQYIQSATDWKNTEGTIFIKPTQLIDDPAIFEIKLRTGLHPPYFCPQGASYSCKLDLRNNTIELVREVYHSLKISRDIIAYADQTFYQNWTGIKFIVYNEIKLGNTQVCLEVWLCNSDSQDERMSNWRRIIRRIDFTGSKWAQGALKAGADFDDQALTWGGPRAIFSWSGLGKLLFKYASFREIEPKMQFRTGGDPGGQRPIITSCPPGQHYDIDLGICVDD